MIALVALILVTLALALRGFFGAKRAFEFPTLLALLFIAFIIPQALHAERTLSLQFDTWFVWLYMIACLLMATFGFEMGKSMAGRRTSQYAPPFQYEHRLVMGAIFLAALGFASASQVRSIASTTELTTQWTGVVTLWYLTMQTTFYALALASLRYLKTPRLAYVLVAILALASIAVMVGNNVKRHMIVETLIILAGAWFFLRGQQPPRVVLLVGFFLGTVLLHQVGVVRAYVQDGRGNAYQAFAEGVPFEQFEYLNVDQSPEVTKAIVDIQYAKDTGILEGPADLWNRLVHQYVPAFLFGRDFKESLKVERYSATDDDYALAQFERKGATRTGFSDTYRSYSVFGALVFMALGLLMGALYNFAVQGRLWAQFYYLVLLNDGMIAVTESTSRFMIGLPFMFAATWIIVRPIARGRRFVDSGMYGRQGSRRMPKRPAWQNART